MRRLNPHSSTEELLFIPANPVRRPVGHCHRSLRAVGVEGWLTGQRWRSNRWRQNTIHAANRRRQRKYSEHFDEGPSKCVRDATGLGPRTAASAGLRSVANRGHTGTIADL
jgi:hypothetical protein